MIAKGVYECVISNRGFMNEYRQDMIASSIEIQTIEIETERQHRIKCYREMIIRVSKIYRREIESIEIETSKRGIMSGWDI